MSNANKYPRGKKLHKELSKIFSELKVLEFDTVISIEIGELKVRLTYIDHPDYEIEMDIEGVEQTIRYLNSPKQYIEDYFGEPADKVLSWQAVIANAKCDADAMGENCDSTLNFLELPTLEEFERDRLYFCSKHAQKFGAWYLDFDSKPEYAILPGVRKGES